MTTRKSLTSWGQSQGSAGITSTRTLAGNLNNIAQVHTRFSDGLPLDAEKQTTSRHRCALLDRLTRGGTLDGGTGSVTSFALPPAWSCRGSVGVTTDYSFIDHLLSPDRYGPCSNTHWQSDEKQRSMRLFQNIILRLDIKNLSGKLAGSNSALPPPHLGTWRQCLHERNSKRSGLSTAINSAASVRLFSNSGTSSAVSFETNIQTIRLVGADDESCDPKPVTFST